MTLYIIAGLIIAAGGYLIWTKRDSRKAGQDEVRADVAVQTVDTMKAQDKAAAEAKAQPVTDTLRKGRF